MASGASAPQAAPEATSCLLSFRPSGGAAAAAAAHAQHRPDQRADGLGGRAPLHGRGASLAAELCARVVPPQQAQHRALLDRLHLRLGALHAMARRRGRPARAHAGARDTPRLATASTTAASAATASTAAATSSSTSSTSSTCCACRRAPGASARCAGRPRRSWTPTCPKGGPSSSTAGATRGTMWTRRSSCWSSATSSSPPASPSALSPSTAYARARSPARSPAARSPCDRRWRTRPPAR